MTVKPVAIDLSPILNFHYCQISNFNFNYLLLNKDNKAMHTPFECKDYLQDMFWSEFTGKKADVYGIHWKQGIIDMSQKFFKLALLGADGHNLSERIVPLQTWLNHFDRALGFKLTKVLPSTKSDYIVVKFSAEWVQNPLLLSAFTTAIRISGDYSVEENPLDYLNRLHNSKNSTEKMVNYMRKDVHRMESFVYKMAALLKGEKPTLPWSTFTNTQEAHDTGISECNQFPTASLEG